MSLINLFILSYFGMMVNKETLGVCVFLIYLMLFYGWLRYSYPIHKNRHYAKHETRTLKTSISIEWQIPKIHDPTS